MFIFWLIIMFLAGYVCGVFMQKKVSELEKHNYLLQREKEEK